MLVLNISFAISCIILSGVLCTWADHDCLQQFVAEQCRPVLAVTWNETDVTPVTNAYRTIRSNTESALGSYALISDALWILNISLKCDPLKKPQSWHFKIEDHASKSENKRVYLEEIAGYFSSETVLCNIEFLNQCADEHNSHMQSPPSRVFKLMQHIRLLEQCLSDHVPIRFCYNGSRYFLESLVPQTPEESADLTRTIQEAEIHSAADRFIQRMEDTIERTVKDCFANPDNAKYLPIYDGSNNINAPVLPWPKFTCWKIAEDNNLLSETHLHQMRLLRRVHQFRAYQTFLKQLSRFQYEWFYILPASVAEQIMAIMDRNSKNGSENCIEDDISATQSVSKLNDRAVWETVISLQRECIDGYSFTGMCRHCHFPFWTPIATYNNYGYAATTTTVAAGLENLTNHAKVTTCCPSCRSIKHHTIYPPEPITHSEWSSVYSDLLELGRTRTTKSAAKTEKPKSKSRKTKPKKESRPSRTVPSEPTTDEISHTVVTQTVEKPRQSRQRLLTGVKRSRRKSIDTDNESIVPDSDDKTTLVPSREEEDLKQPRPAKKKARRSQHKRPMGKDTITDADAETGPDASRDDDEKIDTKKEDDPTSDSKRDGDPTFLAECKNAESNFRRIVLKTAIGGKHMSILVRDFRDIFRCWTSIRSEYNRKSMINNPLIFHVLLCRHDLKQAADKEEINIRVVSTARTRLRLLEILERIFSLLDWPWDHSWGNVRYFSLNPEN